MYMGLVDIYVTRLYFAGVRSRGLGSNDVDLHFLLILTTQ